jgi:phage baseplate assembly protein W
MPLERVSKSFKDISLSFQVNPLSFDLIELKNETAIARSIRNLVFTVPGEKFFNQNIGSKVSQSLFENIDILSASVIKDEIKNTIKNYEPRVNLTQVKVEPNFEDNQFDVTLIYDIIGIEALPQQLSFALLPTR